MKKRLSIAIIFILISILCFTLVACNNPDGSHGNGGAHGGQQQPYHPPYYYDKTLATAYISIDINPSIELTVNYDGKVLSAYGANDDGKVLLYGEDGIVGENVETAIKKITALAATLGYLTADNDCVQTSVTALDETLTQEAVSTIIEEATDDLDFAVRVESLDTYSLTRKLEEFKEENGNNGAVGNLTLDDFRLLSSAATATGNPIAALLSLDDNALLQTITNEHAKAEGYETEEYVKNYNLANNIYQKALGAVTDGIYTSYYIVHHPFKAYYGMAYEGYKLTARGLNAIANAIDYIGEVREYPLSQNHIDDIVAILQLENADELKNANGDVTVKSIEAYADRKFKQTEFSQALEEMKSELSAALKTAQTAIRTTIDELSKKYADEIEVISNSLSSILDGLRGFESLLPTPIQVAINDFSDVVSKLVNIVSDLRISVLEIRSLADKMMEKSNASLNRIQNDLTAAELREIAEIQQSAIDGIEDAKTKFEQAVKDAKDSAKDWLENLKKQRKVA